MPGMLVYVRREGEPTIPLEADASSTVRDLREQLRQQLRVSSMSVRLAFQGAELADDRAELADLGVGSESTVDLLPGLTPEHVRLLVLQEARLVARTLKCTGRSPWAELGGTGDGIKEAVAVVKRMPAGTDAVSALKASEMGGRMGEVETAAMCILVRDDGNGEYTPAEDALYSTAGFYRQAAELQPRPDWGLTKRGGTAKAVLWVDPKQEPLSSFRQQAESSLGVTFFAICSDEVVPEKAARVLKNMGPQMLCVVTNRGRGGDDRAAFAFAAATRRLCPSPPPVVVHSEHVSWRECTEQCCLHAASLQRLGELFRDLLLYNNRE
eukprot:TRINITY_DN6645_c0_g1_i1.p1 TRINITY_DN6645_c0_g1~~TRINITY_DN6645_c0_g1_i1.p1  ORF type:complete len:351 (+),score=115.02 TRINITY_DN6645_c0_g1_i1:80-1054(+)